MLPKKISRRSFLKSAATAGTALPFSAHHALADQNWVGPNLLFVLVDQWRVSSFSHGEFNDPLVHTPNFDRFVEEGARWRKRYVTNPVCSPERATLITGRYPHQTGMIWNNYMLPPGNRCLAEVFREAGYATHYIGKCHWDGAARLSQPDIEGNRGYVKPGWRRRGFTTFEGHNTGHRYWSTANYYDNGDPMNIDYIGTYEPIVETDLAINFIENNKHRPWMCFLSWSPPHPPSHNPPPAFFYHEVLEEHRRPNVPAGNPSPERLAGYFGHCEALDLEFGRLMDELRRMGLDKNTLVVFTSDHGDLISSHDPTLQGHTKNYPQEESLHVPLFMRWPERIAPGQTPDTLISGIDMMPTVLSLCGLPIPRTCVGEDKSAAVLGGPPPVADSIYCEGKMIYRGQAWRAIVTDQYKLVVNDSNPLDLASITMLFDLEADPYELVNLKDDAGHGTIKQQLFDRLVQYRDETGDTFPATPPRADAFYS